MFVRKRNDGNAKTVACNGESGKADAVETDRPFFDHQRGKRFGETDIKLEAAVFGGADDAGAGSIYVSLHKMSVETPVELETAFYIDEAAGLPVAEIGFVECFADGGYAVQVIADLLHGKTHAAVADALIGFKGRRKGGADPKGAVAAFLGNGFYATHGFNDTGKHGAKFQKAVHTSK